MERLVLQLKTNPWTLTPLILGILALMLIGIACFQGFDKVDKYLAPLVIGLIFSLAPSPLSNRGSNCPKCGGKMSCDECGRPGNKRRPRRRKRRSR